MNAEIAELTAPTSAVVVQAWQRFHTTLDEVRRKMEATPRFRDNPQNRAKAYHTLMEVQAMAYNFAVAPRLDHPRMQVNTGWQTNMYTLGQNCMDFFYGVMFADGTRSYRITGRMGDIKLFLWQVLGSLPGRADGKTVGNYDFADFKQTADGHFTAIMSVKKQEGNWIALNPEGRYQFILVRRAMGDWNDDPGELKVELLDPPLDHSYDDDEFDEAAIAKRIDRATDFARYVIEHWNINLYDIYLKSAGGHKNALGLLPGVVTSEVGSPTSNYAMGIFELEPDEALIVELRKAPQSAYWSYQLGDVWSRSLDFRNYQTDINMAHAAVDKDGAVRVVIAHRDPGVANWMDTRNRREGTIVFRNYKTDSQILPTVRKVKFADIAQQLPPETRRVTIEQRAAALRARQQGFERLHGE